MAPGWERCGSGFGRAAGVAALTLLAACAAGEVSGDADGGREAAAHDGAGGEAAPPVDAPIDTAPACEPLGPTEGSGATCGTGDKGVLADNGAAITITATSGPRATRIGTPSWPRTRWGRPRRAATRCT